MTRRTIADWQKLLEDQATSGLSIKAFCQQQSITNSNFYKYRRKLNRSPLETPLIKLSASQSPISKTVTANKSISLRVGETTLSLPELCDPHWLAQLMQALQR